MPDNYQSSYGISLMNKGMLSLPLGQPNSKNERPREVAGSSFSRQYFKLYSF